MDIEDEAERIRTLAQSKGEEMDFIATMAEELTKVARARHAFELACLLKGVAAEAAQLRRAMKENSR